MHCYTLQLSFFSFNNRAHQIDVLAFIYIHINSKTHAQIFMVECIGQLEKIRF